MGSKLILTSILLSSWVFLGFSEDHGGGAVPVDPACIAKLLPCQDYLKDPSSPPPTCCFPLKVMIADDQKCLCGIFNNPEILKNLNVTQEDALKLPKGCGLSVDITECSKVAESPSSSPPTTPVPASSNGTDGNSTGVPAKKNSVDGLSPFSGLGFIATIVALLSAF